MIDGKTSTGFNFSVDERIGNNFRFVEAFADMKSSDEDARLAAMVELPRIVLGRDGASRLMAHVAEPDGFVPTDKMMKEIVNIIQLVGERNASVKNS